MLQIIKTAVAFFLFGALATLMLAFALVNRHPVAFDLSPLPYAGAAPLFIIAFIAFFLGLLAASLMAFLHGIAWRYRLRRQHKQAMALQRELDEIKLATAPKPLPTDVTSGAI